MDKFCMVDMSDRALKWRARLVVVRREGNPKTKRNINYETQFNPLLLGVSLVPWGTPALSFVGVHRAMAGFLF